MKRRRLRIAFTWSGFPDYAARCVRALIDLDMFDVTVVGTRPRVPIEGMESSLGQKIIWIDPEDKSTWASLGLLIPDVLFSGGYGIPSFRRLAREARSAGARSVLMSDNNWVGSFQQRILEPVRHTIFHRPNYEAALVPGRSGFQVARHWGYPEGMIRQGMYGADPSIFFGGASLDQRPQAFLFVGQFIERKNLLALVEAFIQFSEQHPNWTMELCGAGALEDRIPIHSRILVSGFVQPVELASKLRCSKCLVLPSVQEHWGLVVHEAALSGCALALSKSVGSAADFAGESNATLFDPLSVEDIVRALTEMAGWENSRWRSAERESRLLANQFGPSQFALAVSELIKELTCHSVS